MHFLFFFKKFSKFSIMLESARRLKQLYGDLTDKKRQEDTNFKKQYGTNVLLPTDKGTPCPKWFLAIFHVALSKRAVDAFFSIYGLVEEQYHFETKNKMDNWYIKFENDEEVEEVFEAMRKKRLNLGGRVISCYRLREEPQRF